MGIFANPEYLLLLLLLLPVAGLFWFSARLEEQDRKALGEARLVDAILQTPAARRRSLRAALLLASVALIVLALARPRIGRGDEQLRARGLQIMVVLDVSRSMAVQDMRPDRFEFSKNVLSNLLQQMEGNQFGLIVFGRSSHVQFPLTSDLAAARALLEPLTLDSVSSPGSNLKAALEEAQRAFIPGKTSGRVILLISDGGDPDQEQPEGSTAEQARKVAAAGILIHTVGMGTREGGRIPYRDENGRLAYREDDSGEEVISSLNDTLLRQIAEIANGSYFDGEDVSLGDLMDALEQGAPVELTDLQSEGRQERFQIVVALALVLLFAEYLILGRRGAV